MLNFSHFGEEVSTSSVECISRLVEENLGYYKFALSGKEESYSKLGFERIKDYRIKDTEYQIDNLTYSIIKNKLSYSTSNGINVLQNRKYQNMYYYDATKENNLDVYLDIALEKNEHQSWARYRGHEKVNADSIEGYFVGDYLETTLNYYDALNTYLEEFEEFFQYAENEPSAIFELVSKKIKYQDDSIQELQGCKVTSTNGTMAIYVDDYHNIRNIDTKFKTLKSGYEETKYYILPYEKEDISLPSSKDYKERDAFSLAKYINLRIGEEE